MVFSRGTNQVELLWSVWIQKLPTLALRCQDKHLLSIQRGANHRDRLDPLKKTPSTSSHTRDFLIPVQRCTNHLKRLLIAVDSLHHALTKDPSVVDEQVQPVAFLVDLRTRASFHQPRATTSVVRGTASVGVWMLAVKNGRRSTRGEDSLMTHCEEGRRGRTEQKHCRPKRREFAAVLRTSLLILRMSSKEPRSARTVSSSHPGACVVCVVGSQEIDNNHSV